MKVADWRDIACMKLDAVSSRGSKKDFIDLYFICQKISLKRLLKIFAKKYKSVDFNLMHILKSLVYFKEAEKEPLPRMLKRISWPTVKSFFIREVRKLI
ncbi:MAG: nucleotidyl transferase AbiEii/AbiGii toxin family protein [Patescibacteria group bacterium]|nr:nucleotidyl transferase AbiEii/AbiGii toxin family protein [Patescibacteria group bacterium]